VNMADAPAFAPGVYDDMPAEQYHALEALSSSGIKKLLRSPAHYLVERTKRNEPTEAMRIGTAVHTLILEPHREAEVIEMPAFNARTAAGRADRDAWLAEHAGAQAFDAETLGRIRAAVAAVRAHPGAALLLSDGRPEVSLLWHDATLGAPCKARADFLRADGGMVDVKTTADASPAGFRRAIGSFLYHVQAAWYFNGAEHLLNATPPYWCFVCVETDPPFGVAVYSLDSASIRAGGALCARALRTYAECIGADRWPAYVETIEPISAPRWALIQET